MIVRDFELFRLCDEFLKDVNTLDYFISGEDLMSFEGSLDSYTAD